jgi:hypothetical protein
MSFLKMKDRKVKQVLSEGWYQCECEDTRKGYRRVHMVEIIIYSCMRMEK